MGTETPRKVAIVTGAGQGIGAAIAERLASDGFDIGLADLPGAKANVAAVAAKCEAAGARTLSVPTDVSVKAQVDEVVERVALELGRVDVMVANAGIAPVGPFLDLSEDTFDKLFAINVKGVLWSYQAAARQMIKQGGGGKLIAAASVAGLQSHSGFAGYSATKFAVRSLNQAASLEFAKHGITCNVYCPAPVDTNMWTAIDQTLGGAAGAPEGAVTGQILASCPLGRLATPEDVSGLVSFLAGPDSNYCTGSAMLVAGGFTLS